MTRLIGGVAGGRRIAVPPTGVRPTSDRVREALFSLLEARGVLEDADVLDLFAGSGALGLEALSRGALGAIVDPPYADPVDEVLALLPAWLTPGGLVVLERDVRSPAPSWPDELEPEESRTYGDTALHLARRTD